MTMPEEKPAEGQIPEHIKSFMEWLQDYLQDRIDNGYITPEMASQIVESNWMALFPEQFEAVDKSGNPLIPTPLHKLDYFSRVTAWHGKATEGAREEIATLRTEAEKADIQRFNDYASFQFKQGAMDYGQIYRIAQHQAESLGSDAWMQSASDVLKEWQTAYVEDREAQTKWWEERKERTLGVFEGQRVTPQNIDQLREIERTKARIATARAEQKPEEEWQRPPISSAYEAASPFLEQLPERMKGHFSYQELMRKFQREQPGAREQWWAKMMPEPVSGDVDPGMFSQDLAKQMGISPKKAQQVGLSYLQDMGAGVSGTREEKASMFWAGVETAGHPREEVDPGIDPWKKFLQNYPFLAEFQALPPRERGYYPSTYAPPTRWLNY